MNDIDRRVALIKLGAFGYALKAAAELAAKTVAAEADREREDAKETSQ